MINILLVASGGAFGAAMRFIATSSIKYFLPNLPFGTLFVNILGSFMIGLLMSYMEYKNISSNIIKYFIIIGILGSFTTFSTFSYEVIDLLNHQKILISFFYIFTSLVTCLFFCYLGYNFNKI